MEDKTSLSEEKRFTLRIDSELWRRLRIEAAKRDTSTTILINQLLEKSLSEIEDVKGAIDGTSS